MNKLVYLILLFTLLSGCAPTSKFVNYRPPFSATNYIIEVRVKSKLPAVHSLYINDKHIADMPWGMSYTEEVKGTYQDKPVAMKGQFYPGGRVIFDVEISGEKAAQIEMP